MADTALRDPRTEALMRPLDAFALSAAALVLTAQASPPATPALTVHAVVDGKLYWIEGGGGNSGVIIGSTGVILVDAKTTPDAGRALIAEVAKLTPKPVTHVILTHSDGDHVNGLAGMPDGLKIVAHAANKAEQLAVYQFAAVEVNGGRCLPPDNRIPNRIVYNDLVRTTIDGVPIVLHHFAPAHTGGDLVVELPRYRFAFAGDLITSSVLIHPEKSGTFEGWFATAKSLLALPVDHYLGGHAKNPDTKATLARRRDDYAAIKVKVDALVDGGKTLAEVKTAMGDPAKDPSGCRGIPYPSLAEVEFNARTGRNNELK